MARFAEDLIERVGFACGVAYYETEYPGRPTGERLVLYIALATGLYPFVVDTGAPWSVLNPEIAESLGGNLERDVCLGKGERIRIQGAEFEGWLCKTRVTLRSECDGMDLDLSDVTVFVPTLDEGQPWPYPNFLGMRTFLNHIRYAVDPRENAFYFGQP